VADRLRPAGINSELWLDPESKLDKQLKYADQKQIPYVIIIGDSEAKENKVTLKNLKNRTQETLSLEEAKARIMN
jgi:histidyl-tRNA synthetase